MKQKPFWNHRVVRREINPVSSVKEFYGIYETYYDPSGQVIAFTGDPTPIEGGSLAELKHVHAQMTQALRQPILDYSTRKPIHKTGKETKKCLRKIKKSATK